jgi:hypothetical protein
MPSRWLLPLVLAGLAPAGVAPARQLPPADAPPPAGELPAVPTEPPPCPCEYVIPPLASRPRCQPDYVQFLSGVSRTTSLGPNIPDFNYTPITARVGWYLTDPLAPGAVSVLVDYSTDIVTDGFGHWVTGPSLSIRYERRPDRVLVPYVEAGIGLAFNDAYRDKSQRAIGAYTEFYDHAGGGVHYRFAPCWSFDVEVLFQHISNAGLTRRNLGVNNLGVLAGLTYRFGGP